MLKALPVFAGLSLPATSPKRSPRPGRRLVILVECPAQRVREGHRLYVEELRPGLSVTMVGVERPSTSGRATPASIEVTSPIQSEDSHGVTSSLERSGAAVIRIAFSSSKPSV